MVWIQKYNKLVLRDYPFIWINMVKVENFIDITYPV